MKGKLDDRPGDKRLLIVMVALLPLIVTGSLFLYRLAEKTGLEVHALRVMLAQAGIQLP